MTAKVIVEARNAGGKVLHRIELDGEMFADGEIVKLYDAEIASLWFYREDGPSPKVDTPPDQPSETKDAG